MTLNFRNENFSKFRRKSNREENYKTKPKWFVSFQADVVYFNSTNELVMQATMYHVTKCNKIEDFTPG